MTEADLLPRRGSIHMRPIFELVDDVRCDSFADGYNEDHSACTLMAACWPTPGPYDDLDDQ